MRNCVPGSVTGVRARAGLPARAADCRFMHCLPVRRNVAVADEVLDGPRSAVKQQAHNRLVAQMAVLHRMLKDTPAGGRISP